MAIAASSPYRDMKRWIRMSTGGGGNSNGTKKKKAHNLEMALECEVANARLDTTPKRFRPYQLFKRIRKWGEDEDDEEQKEERRGRSESGSQNGGLRPPRGNDGSGALTKTASFNSLSTTGDLSEMTMALDGLPNGNGGSNGDLEAPPQLMGLRQIDPVDDTRSESSSSPTPSKQFGRRRSSSERFGRPVKAGLLVLELQKHGARDFKTMGGEELKAEYIAVMIMTLLFHNPLF